MGLISWIKDKYYDSQLNKADTLVLENDLNRAEEIYRSLLGKQDQAVVNLANMFATHANSVEERLKALKNIDHSCEQFAKALPTIHLKSH